MFGRATIRLGIGPHSSSIFFFYLFIFLAYSQASQIGCLPYFHTWYGLSENLECRFETAARGSLEIQDAKNRQKLAIWAPLHKFVGIYLLN